MDRKRIEDLDEWLAWKERIISAGFRLWQTQYSWDQPEGYIAGFINVEDHQRFEIVTHSEEIEEDMIGSGM